MIDSKKRRSKAHRGILRVVTEIQLERKSPNHIKDSRPLFSQPKNHFPLSLTEPVVTDLSQKRLMSRSTSAKPKLISIETPLSNMSMDPSKKIPISDQYTPIEKFKEPIQPSVDTPIDPYEWFMELVGCTEKEFRSNPENIFFHTDEGLCIRNRTNGVITKCGKLTLTKFADLFNQEIIKYPFFPL